MSFRDNLQHMRATRSMTQEQLAMMVGVSRQSVTKWEAEKAYPEMDKLLKLCQIFDCTLDELVKGDLTTRVPEPALALPLAGAAEDTVGYVEHHLTHALRMGVGVACFIVGCGLGLVAAGLTYGAYAEHEVLVPVFVLLFVIAGLAIVLPEDNRHKLFMREHPFVIDFFTSESRAKWSTASTRSIVIGTAAIIAGVIFMLIFMEGTDGNEALEMTLSGTMLVVVALGVGLIVHGGCLSDMIDLEHYNYEAICNLSEADAAELLDSLDAEKRERYLRKRRVSTVVGALCGITMLIATIAGLLLLFLTDTEMFWVPWPIGGIVCAIVATVGEMLEKRR